MQGFIGLVMLIRLTIIQGELIDLSHKYDNQSLFYPAYFPFKLEKMHRGWFQLADGQAWVEFNEFRTVEHMATHIDAPAHFSDRPGHWRLDEIPIDRFMGPAVVLDISERADVVSNPDASLTLQDLQAWEEMHGRIPDGSIIMVDSGWCRHWGDKKKFMGTETNDTALMHWPGVSVEAARWLVSSRSVYGVGVDTMSLDSGDQLPYHHSHIELLKNNVYILENLNNLHKIPRAGAHVYVFPMNIAGGSGAPTRVIAEWDSDRDSAANAQASHGICTALVAILSYLTAQA